MFLKLPLNSENILQSSTFTSVNDLSFICLCLFSLIEAYRHKRYRDSVVVFPLQAADVPEASLWSATKEVRFYFILLISNISTSSQSQTSPLTIKL